MTSASKSVPEVADAQVTCPARASRVRLGASVFLAQQFVDGAQAPRVQRALLAQVSQNLVLDELVLVRDLVERESRGAREMILGSLVTCVMKETSDLRPHDDAMA